MHEIFETVRVKKIENGKAIGKSFRVYKVSYFKSKVKNDKGVWEYNEAAKFNYLKYSPTAKIDKSELTFKVTKDYERIPVPKPIPRRKPPENNINALRKYLIDKYQIQLDNIKIRRSITNSHKKTIKLDKLTLKINDKISRLELHLK